MTYLKNSVGENQWNDIIIPGAALGAGASAPDPISHPSASTVIVYGFDGNNILEQLYGQFELPHDYEQGSILSPHVHWTPTTTASGSVIWNMDYAYANVNDVHISGTVSGECSGGGTGIHRLCALTDISITGARIGGVMSIRLYRNPTASGDTYINDAALLSIGIHYKSDTLGSREIASK